MNHVHFFLPMISSRLSHTIMLYYYYCYILTLIDTEWFKLSCSNLLTVTKI